FVRLGAEVEQWTTAVVDKPLALDLFGADVGSIEGQHVDRADSTTRRLTLAEPVFHHRPRRPDCVMLRKPERANDPQCLIGEVLPVAEVLEQFAIYPKSPPLFSSLEIHLKRVERRARFQRRGNLCLAQIDSCTWLHYLGRGKSRHLQRTFGPLSRHE